MSIKMPQYKLMLIKYWMDFMIKVCSLDFLKKEVFDTDIKTSDGFVLFETGEKITPEIILRLYFKEIYVSELLNEEPYQEEISITDEIVMPGKTKASKKGSKKKGQEDLQEELEQQEKIDKYTADIEFLEEDSAKKEIGKVPEIDFDKAEKEKGKSPGISFDEREKEIKGKAPGIISDDTEKESKVKSPGIAFDKEEKETKGPKSALPDMDSESSKKKDGAKSPSIDFDEKYESKDKEKTKDASYSRHLLFALAELNGRQDVVYCSAGWDDMVDAKRAIPPTIK